MLWKCLDYSDQEIKEASAPNLKAMMLTEWAACRSKKPPEEFGKFVATVVLEMKKRGIDHREYIG